MEIPKKIQNLLNISETIWAIHLLGTNSFQPQQKKKKNIEASINNST